MLHHKEMENADGVTKPEIPEGKGTDIDTRTTDELSNSKGADLGFPSKNLGDTEDVNIDAKQGFQHWIDLQDRIKTEYNEVVSGKPPRVLQALSCLHHFLLILIENQLRESYLSRLTPMIRDIYRRQLRIREMLDINKRRATASEVRTL